MTDKLVEEHYKKCSGCIPKDVIEELIESGRQAERNEVAQLVKTLYDTFDIWDKQLEQAKAEVRREALEDVEKMMHPDHLGGACHSIWKSDWQALKKEANPEEMKK